MTAKEMMLPWFGVIVELGATPEMIARYKPGDLDIPVSTKGRQIPVVTPRPLPEIR